MSLSDILNQNFDENINIIQADFQIFSFPMDWWNEFVSLVSICIHIWFVYISNKLTTHIHNDHSGFKFDQWPVRLALEIRNKPDLIGTLRLPKTRHQAKMHKYNWRKACTQLKRSFFGSLHVYLPREKSLLNDYLWSPIDGQKLCLTSSVIRHTSPTTDLFGVHLSFIN